MVTGDMIRVLWASGSSSETGSSKVMSPIPDCSLIGCGTEGR